MAILYLGEEHTRLKSYSATTKGGISTIRIDLEVTDPTRLGFLLSDLGEIEKDQKAQKEVEKRAKAKGAKKACACPTATFVTPGAPIGGFLMGAPKPAMGFVSRTEAIMAMRGQGLSPHQMADRLGISVKNVAALEFSAKRTDRHTELRKPQDHVFPLHIRQQLRPHALKRGVSVDRLINDLVAVIAESNLVDAVLDDAPVEGDR